MTPDSAAHYTKRIIDLHLRELQSIIPPTPRQIGGWLLATTEERAEVILQALEASGIWRSPSAFRRLLRCPIDATLMRETWEEAEIFDDGDWISLQEFDWERSNSPRVERPVSRDARMSESMKQLGTQKSMRRPQ